MMPDENGAATRTLSCPRRERSATRHARQEPYPSDADPRQIIAPSQSPPFSRVRKGTDLSGNKGHRS